MIDKLSNISIAGMLRLLTAYKQSSVLHISSKDGKGDIYLKNSVIVKTKIKKTKLEKEVLRLLTLREGFFQFKPLESISKEQKQGRLETIEELILASSRLLEQKAIEEYLPPVEAVLQLAPIYGDRKQIHLNMQREEWNLLTVINGEDTLEQLLDKTDIQTGRAKQIIYGLLSAGLIRKTRFQIPQVMEIAGRELGDMGEAIVRQAFKKLSLNPARMHMRELILLLNELEKNITLLLGPSRASNVVMLMWEGAKR
jgi:hypothetical protein